MSAVTVARNDVRSLRRSYVVGVVAVFAAIVGLAFLGSSEVHSHPYRTLWGFIALVAWVFPLFLAPVTYLAIAGDVARGSIRYHLGLPNSRGGYVAAKWATRAAVAVVAVATAVVVTFVVAATTYPDPPDPARFLTFGAISILFALAMAGAFLGISAATASRSRAMVGVLGAYFVLCAFWVGPLPALNLETLLAAIEAVPGLAISESLQALIGSLSPAGAYFNATQLVLGDVADRHEAFAPLRDTPDNLGLQPWCYVRVMVAWAALAPLAGYLAFRGSELG